MSMRDLLEQRGKTVAAMRAITDKPAGDTGNLSEQQVVDFDRLETELETVKASIRRQQVVDDAERTMAAPAIISGNGRDGQYEERARQFSIVRAINGFLGTADAGFEKEISAEVQRRAGRPFMGIAVPDEAFLERRVLTVGPLGSPTPNAEALYPTTLRPDLFIDRLRSALVVQRLGATVLDGLVGTVEIPRQYQSSAAQHIAEEEALTPTDAAFDDVQLTPKTVGALTSYSRRTMINATPSIEAIVRRDLAAVLANAIDFQAMFGDGTNDTPTGVRNVTGVHNLTLAGPTWPQVLDMPAQIQADDADTGAMAFVMHPLAVATLRQTLKDAGDTSSNFLMSEPGNLAGYSVAVTTAAPANTVLFGVWSELLVGFWSGLDLLLNPFQPDDYTRGRISLRAMRDYDVQVRHPQSFAFAEDL
jgi:HK97 family phage major capsid protein